MGLGYTTTVTVSTMTCSIDNLVKDFKNLEADCLSGDKTMAQEVIIDLKYPLTELSCYSTTTQKILQMMTQMLNQASKKPPK